MCKAVYTFLKNRVSRVILESYKVLKIDMSTSIEMLIIFALLFTKVEMHTFGKQNFTSEWLVVMKDTLYPPMVTDMKNQLVYVSFPSDFAIKLETSKIINKPCVVPASVIKDRKGKHVTPVYAETLGNGKIIISILETRKKTNQSQVWLYAIDPQNCSYIVDKFALDAKYSATDIMAVVPYKQSFEVFMKSHLHCIANNICSLHFTDKLELLEKRNSAIAFDDEGWALYTIKDYDSSDGYLYIVMMNESNNTIMKRFDSNFNTVQTIQLNYSGSIAYSFNEDGSSSSCFSVTDQEIRCVFLDAQMQVKVDTSLIYDSYVQYYSIFQLKNGDAIVLTILSSDPDGSDSATYVQYLSMDRAFSSLVKFQEFICENVYEMSMFELKEGVYCASTMCRNDVNTKCISSEEILEF